MEELEKVHIPAITCSLLFAIEHELVFSFLHNLTRVLCLKIKTTESKYAAIIFFMSSYCMQDEPECQSHTQRPERCVRLVGQIEKGRAAKMK